MRTYGSSTYGQNIAGKIAYWEKMGIGMGIRQILRKWMHDRNHDINEYKHTYPNGYESLCVNFIIPTPKDIHQALNFPTFYYNGELDHIDMIIMDESEIQLHFMGMYHKGHNHEWINDGWHTLRESLSLNDAMALYEYILERADSLMILPPDKTDAYNQTGALQEGYIM